MENNVKKGKRGGYHERDLLKKVVRQYKTAIIEVKSQFDLLISGALSANGRKPVKIQPPDFVQIILIPIIQRLAEMLPEYDVELLGKDEIEPDDKGYFPIRIGGHIVAGICFGGQEAQHIKVALFPFKKLWGKPFSVKSMTDLKAIAEMVIEIIDIPKRESGDENRL
jgi:hypothetical protein